MLRPAAAAVALLIAVVGSAVGAPAPDERSRMEQLMNGNVPNTVRVREEQAGGGGEAMAPLGPPAPPARVLAGILSAPRNFAQRRAIRESWFRYVQDDTVSSLMTSEEAAAVAPLFFIGQPAGDDAADLNDAIARETDVVRLPDLMESYDNLTLKVALMMEYAFEADYDVLLKLDDDDFVRLDLLMAQLRGMGPTEDLYWGRLKRNVTVIHQPGHKWYEGRFRGDTYPDYMLGSGYAVGRMVLRHVASSIGNLTMYANEDASVGIWTRELPLRRVRMLQMVLQPWCEAGAVVVNSVEPFEQAQLFSAARAGGSICAKDFYLDVCRREPCKCCVDPHGNPHAQVDELCCY